MGEASFLQTDFRGGLWSSFSQGRMDDKDYSRGLNVCFNSYPIEEGAWTRRQGTRFVCFTRAGLPAFLQTFAFETISPYVMEFTDSNLRFISQGANLVLTNDAQQVTSISTANPAVVTTGDHEWNTGDVVQFLFPSAQDTSAAGILMNRQFTITVTGDTTFTIADSVTGAGIDGSTFTMPLNLSVGRVLVITSPYTQAQLPTIRTIQAEILSNNALQGQVVCLAPTVAPQVVVNSVAETTNAFANFTMSAITFKDGPYFDPVTGASVTPSGLTGTITLTGAPASTFVSTDVGRLIRIFSEPAAWAVGTGYSAGNIVKYTDGNYYTAIAASTGKAPNAYLTLWALTPNAAVWAWGTISVYHSATSVDVAVDASQALLYTTAFTTFRLGLYSVTTGYPTCGVFTEGRLWLAGAQGNRFDASNSNDPFNFSPTAPDGTVGDANAISYIFNSDDVNPIFWMAADHAGIICGTSGGEWVIQASNLNDPLTPTSCQARRVTKYKCANTPPARAGLGLLFVKAHARRLMEFVADVFSGKFLGRNVAEKAQQLTAPSIAQLVYQQDLTPNAWIRMVDGTWAGMLYRRDSSFTSEAPTFMGWHNHLLGSNCTVESIAVGPSNDGTLENVFMAVNDPTTGYRHVEYLVDMFNVADPIYKAWHLDGAAPATAIVVNSAHTQVTFYGFTMYIGKTISLWVGGLDLGDYVVASDGSVVVTLGGAAQSSTVGLGLPLFTYAFFSTWDASQKTTYDTSVSVQFAQGTPPLATQSFIDTSIVAGTLEVHDAVYDPNNDRLVTTSTGHATTDGIRVFKLSTGLQTAAATAATLFPSGAGTTNAYVKYPYAIDANGYMYWLCTGGNSQRLVKCDLKKMLIVGQLGAASNQFYTNQNHVEASSNMVCLNVGGKGTINTNYLVTAASVTNTGVSVINVDAMQWANFTSQITEKIQNLCAGPQVKNGFNSYSYAFIVGQSNIIATTAIGIYTLKIDPTAAAQMTSPTLVDPPDAAVATNTGITLTRTGGLTPANIDAAWTNISGIYGPIFDATDGTIIIWAYTTDAVAHPKYIIKINPYTAAISWQTAVANTPTLSLTGSNWSVCANGTVIWMSGSNYYSVTTAAGTLTSSTVSGYSAVQAQWSDDNYMRLYSGAATLSGGGGSPAPINSTPGTFSDQWAYIQGETTPPSVSEYTFPVLPALAGFTYTSQGQLLRPVGEKETGAKLGPGFAETRRVERVGAQLASTQGIFFGSTFDGSLVLRPAVLLNKATTLAVNVMFTGVLREFLECANDFDGMIAWQITRPYPATVTAIAGFIATNDV